MTVYYNQTFEGGTLGSLPAGWSSKLASGTTVGLSNTYAHGGSQSLKFTLGTTAGWNSVWATGLTDSNYGCTWLESWVYVPSRPSSLNTGFLLRATAPSAASWPPAGFMFMLPLGTSDTGITFIHCNGASASALATFSPTSYSSLFAAGVWYRVIFCVRDVISNLNLPSTFQNDSTQIEMSVCIQRGSDGNWLVNNGTTAAWTNTGVQTCVLRCYFVGQSTPDPPAKAWWPSGLAMIAVYSGNSTACYFDDAIFQDYPTPPSLPAFTWTPGNSVELQGTYVSIDAGSSPLSNMSDGNFDTAYVSTAQQEAWAGLDLGSGKTVTPTAILFSPQTDHGNEYSCPYYQIEGAASTSGPWTTLAQNPIEAQQRYCYIRIPFNTASTYRVVRLRHMTDFMRVSEFRLEGQLNGTGSPSWQPVRPSLNPASGKYANGSTVTITTPTSGASIYYTVDGSTPTVTGGVPQGTTTLYTGPVTLPSNALTTLQAIAYHSSGTTPSSAVSTGVFRTPQQYVSDTGATQWGSTENWPETLYDDRGWIVVSTMYPSLLYDNNVLYMFCETYNTANDTSTYYWSARGFWVYGTTDFYNWTYYGVIPSPPVNENWRASPYGGGWYGRFVRPHIFVNPSPINPNKKYVLLARPDWLNSSGKVPVATAPALLGPWTWQGLITYGSDTDDQDCSIFADTNGDVWFVYHHNNSPDSIVAAKLDPTTDYTSFIASSAVTLDTTGAQEAPFIVQYRGSYYLFCSYNTNYCGTNTRMKYKAATGSSLAGVASTMASTALSTIWSSPPTSGTVQYDAQACSFFAIPSRKGFLFSCSNCDAGDPTKILYHGRPVFYPVPYTNFVTGATPSFSMAAPASWNLGNLPAAGCAAFQQMLQQQGST